MRQVAVLGLYLSVLFIIYLKALEAGGEGIKTDVTIRYETCLIHQITLILIAVDQMTVLHRGSAPVTFQVCQKRAHTALYCLENMIFVLKIFDKTVKVMTGFLLFS